MNKQDKLDLKARIKGYRRLNTAQFFMLTFDLKGSKGREAIYARFGTQLRALLGEENVHKIIKQCYFVKSKFHLSDVRHEMQISLGESDSIIVVRLKRGHSYSLRTPGAGSEATQYFGKLKQAELEAE